MLCITFLFEFYIEEFFVTSDHAPTDTHILNNSLWCICHSCRLAIGSEEGLAIIDVSWNKCLTLMGQHLSLLCMYYQVCFHGCQFCFHGYQIDFHGH